MTKYRCNSCDGEYDSLNKNGMPYYHVCPEGTKFSRDENLVHDEELLFVPGGRGRPKNVRPKKGKARDKGGAKKI